MTDKKFVYYEIDKLYLCNVCLTQPAGACLWFPQLTIFLNLLKELLFLISFGTSSQIFGLRYFTDCKP